MRTSQTQFLQAIDVIDGTGHDGEKYSDLVLSDYNHQAARALKNVSPRRWLHGVRLKLSPGSGSGVLTVGTARLKVVYAWGGRNKPGREKAWFERTSYTVRVEGDDAIAAVRKLRDRIILDEEGSLTYRKRFRSINPTPEQKAKEYSESRKFVRQERIRRIASADVLRLWSLPSIRRMMADYETEWNANPMVTLVHRLRKIETDRLPAVSEA